MTADDRAQANAVLTAKRMVAHENIAFAVVLVGKVLLAFYGEPHVKVLDAFLKPLGAFLPTMLVKKSVDLVLMDETTKPCHEKAWHVSSLIAHLAAQYPL